MINLSNDFLAELQSGTFQASLNNSKKIEELRMLQEAQKNELFHAIVAIHAPKTASELLTNLTNLGISIKRTPAILDHHSMMHMMQMGCKTALHFLIERHTANVDQKSLQEKIRILKEQGNLIDAIDDKGLDPLDYAIIYNDNIAAEALMAEGAVPSRKKSGSMNMAAKPNRLMLAIQHENLFMVKKLILANVDVNYCPDPMLFSPPLMCAIKTLITNGPNSSNEQILALLINHHNISLKDRFNLYGSLPAAMFPGLPFTPITLLDVAMLKDTILPPAFIAKVKKRVSQQILEIIVSIQSNLQRVGLSDIDFFSDLLKTRFEDFFSFGTTEASQAFIKAEVERLAKDPNTLQITMKQSRTPFITTQFGLSLGGEKEVKRIKNQPQLQTQPLTNALTQSQPQAKAQAETQVQVQPNPGTFANGMQDTRAINGASNGTGMSGNANGVNGMGFKQ